MSGKPRGPVDWARHYSGMRQSSQVDRSGGTGPVLRLRRPGGRWRLLVHEYLGRVPGQREGVGGLAHHVAPDAKGIPDSEFSRTHVLPGTEFDELAVGRWLHVEQLDTHVWWLNVGGVTVHATVDREGRPTRVWVAGPDDYDAPVAGCTYELTWGPHVVKGDE